MLYLVGTPIGNLGDITLRALETLKGADLIAAEDTRHSLALLQRHGISRPLVSYHEHNEASRTAQFIGQLRQGANIALITDAGMPTISDPGLRIVQACIEAGLPYDIIPGVSSVPTALAGSGLHAEEYTFVGFLPPKSGGRAREIARAIRRPGATVLFESPHRLLRTLALLAELAPSRQICVARELTKIHQEYRRGLPAELLAHYSAKDTVKGEITLILDSLTKKERRQAEANEDETDDQPTHEPDTDDDDEIPSPAH